jgi:ribonuclease D
LVELFRVLLKQRCEDFEVAQKLVASADDLEAIAAADDAPVRALHGWRHEVFGRDALALKHGELALTAGNNRIELVPLPERSEAADD